MTTKMLQKYANELKCKGLSESQIARSLGMSLAHFMGLMNGVDVDKAETEAPKKPEPKKSKKEKPVSGAEQPVNPEPVKEEPKPEEDFNWMDD